MTIVPTGDILATLDDVKQVDERIRQLEREREATASMAKGHTAQQETTDEDAQRAHDLASQLEAAIRSSDLSTIEALELSFGPIQSISAAKNLIRERERLTKLREQRVIYDQLKQELSQSLDYNFDDLKSIKERIYELTDETLQKELETSLDTIVLSYKSEFMEKLANELSKSHWIKSDAIEPSVVTAFTRLINLQSLLSIEPKYPTPLWAFVVVAQGFKIAFDYHFNSDKDTNRIDRPELFFNYLIKYLEAHLSKINRLFTLNGTEFDNRYAHSEFISAAIIPLKEKLIQCIHTLRRGTSKESTDDTDVHLLIHLIRETVNFDQHLFQEFFFDPLNDGLWPGLFDMFGYAELEVWLDREINLSIKNFASIVNDNNVFQIDYASVGDNELKPTVSAIKLKYLFESTTRTFQKFFVPNYEANSNLNKFKLKLFSGLYLRFLEQYYDRLNDAAIALSDLIRHSRSLIYPSKDAEVDITGVNGLERLFRIYCSLKYVIQSLNVWNHEVIFIELNKLYNKISGAGSISLFSSILGDYDGLQQKVFELTTKFYGRSIEALLKNYGNLNSWNQITEIEKFTLSNELVTLIDKVQALLDFTRKTLPEHDYNRIKNSVSQYIADYLFQNIIKNNHFNTHGVKQLSLDFTTVWEKLNLKRNFPMYHKLVESFQVLNLTDEQIQDLGSYGSVKQLARAGEFDGLRNVMQLNHLKDGDLLDIMLRIH